jgi:hypothetical protein
MLLHAATPRLECSHGSDDWLATSAAKSLARLYRSAASIAEHKFLPWDSPTTHTSQQMIRKLWPRVPFECYQDSVEPSFDHNAFLRMELSPQNEKAARQQGDLFFSRENSSNRGFRIRRNFLTKSYGPKKGGVKQFLSNKCLCFQ